MKASVLLAHPTGRVSNHAIFETVCRVLREKGVEVLSHDLYAERFDPVHTVEEPRLGHVARSPSSTAVRASSWNRTCCSSYIPTGGQPPAVLKGYIDRDIRPPHAYDFPPGDSGGGLRSEARRETRHRDQHHQTPRWNAKRLFRRSARAHLGGAACSASVASKNIIEGCSPSSRTATRTSGGAGSRRPKGSWTRRSRAACSGRYAIPSIPERSARVAILSIDLLHNWQVSSRGGRRPTWRSQKATSFY